MNLRTERATGRAVTGNRSPRYFGIALFMDQSFFTKTRDGKCGVPRPDPRIKGFCRSTQNALRERIIESATKHGYTLADADNEWMHIVSLATVAATDTMAKSGAGKTNEDPITRRNGGELLNAAFKAACREAASLVHEREIDAESWQKADNQKMFAFKPTRHKRSVPLSLREAVLRETPFCVRCGAVPPDAILHVDHVVPLKQGGSNDRDNLQVLCRDCNLGKGPKLETK